jgi:uncharacterized glyoxalase superfamily protein PhnB
MQAASNVTATRLVPLMRYRDVAAAIEWLCATFGFGRHLVVVDDEGAVTYAQLSCGNGIIMLCPVEGSGLDSIMAQPDEVGGIETQSCYLVVEDADAHYSFAKAAGAQIVLDIKGNDAGRRGYSCRDPEGHIWSFGTYDPWASGLTPVSEVTTVATPATVEHAAPVVQSFRRPFVTVGALLCAALVAWGTYGVFVRSLFAPEPTFYNIQTRPQATAQPQPRVDRAAEEAAKRALRAAQQQIAALQAEKAASDRALQDMQNQVIQLRRDKEEALGQAQHARGSEDQAKSEISRLQKQLAAREAELEAEAEEDEESHKASAAALKSNRAAHAAAIRAASRARRARLEARKRRWAAEEKAKLPWPHNMW